MIRIGHYKATREDDLDHPLLKTFSRILFIFVFVFKLFNPNMDMVTHEKT